MKRTAKNLEAIRQIMNTNPVIQAQMTKLAKLAEEKNISGEQWNEFKTRMMTTMFYKMCEMIPEFKEELGADIYETLRV